MRPRVAINYYLADNYYQQHDGLNASHWWGPGATELGLVGPVADEVFANLCEGLDPTGQVRLRRMPHVGESIGGTDTTFSAPKSVSLAAIVGGDERLILAHRAAVKFALEQMERDCLKTTVKHRRVKATHPVVAIFEHDTSRALDPQLHTHCFWMNVCKAESGKWQRVEAIEFFRQKMRMGQLYRTELVRLCEVLGHKIEHRPDGLFELAGYSREQIESFSERHGQILGMLAELGLKDTTGNRIYAVMKTRPAKQSGIDRAALRDYWERTAESLGIEHPRPAQKIEAPAVEPEPQKVLPRVRMRV